MRQMQEMWVRSLCGEDPLEKRMATHSSILAWKIPWTEEPGGLQSMGSQRVRHNWALMPHSLSDVTWAPLSHPGASHLNCWWNMGSSLTLDLQSQSFRAGVLNLWDLMPDDLRWSWYNNNRNKVHNEYNVLEASPNHPPPPPPCHPGSCKNCFPPKWALVAKLLGSTAVESLWPCRGGVGHRWVLTDAQSLNFDSFMDPWESLSTLGRYLVAMSSTGC